MRYHFTIGKEYSRQELRGVTGQNSAAKGGDWDTGCAELYGEFFIFCNVEAAGRTGHNYGNHFQGDDLIWFTSNTKSRETKQTKRLLAAETTKYIFTREKDRDKFVYQGTAQPKNIQGDNPVQVIWTISKTIEKQDTYFARLCWNTSEWVRPSGDASQSELKTFASENGFGHEEWLFDFNLTINGFHYGFIQGVNFSLNRLASTTFSLQLYSINSDGGRWLIGNIKSASALTEQEADSVKEQYQKRGWLDLMKEQVRNVGGDPKNLEATTPGTGIFNIKFKPEDAEIYEPYRPVSENDRVHKLKRYQLVAVNGDELPEEVQSAEIVSTPNRAGTQTLKPTSPFLRKPGTSKEIDPIHNKMQNEIFNILKNQHGELSVVLEENFVDIKVTGPTKTTFIEIKTDPSPRKAIRQALGQLMEYAFFNSSLYNNTDVELIVVAPRSIESEGTAYLKKLQSQFKIPISYKQFSLDSKIFNID